MEYPIRVHISAQSRSDPYYQHNMTNGLAISEKCDPDLARFYFLDGGVISMVIPWYKLNNGWRVKRVK